MRLLALVISLAAQVVAPLVSGMPAEDVRHDLQTMYQKASVAYVAARTLADMEAIHRWLDTPDCRFRDVGQPFRTWAEMRPSVIAGLQTGITSMTTRIEKIEVDAQSNTVIATTQVQGVARLVDHDGRFGRVGAEHDIETTATVKDTWVKTTAQWRRKAHEKIAPNAITAVDGKPLRR